MTTRSRSTAPASPPTWSKISLPALTSLSPPHLMRPAWRASTPTRRPGYCSSPSRPARDVAREPPYSVMPVPGRGTVSAWPFSPDP
jgi:hypothetical protein